MGPHPASYTLHHFCIQGEREKQSHPQNASPWGWRELVPKRPKPQQAGLGGDGPHWLLTWHGHPWGETAPGAEKSTECAQELGGSPLMAAAFSSG